MPRIHLALMTALVAGAVMATPAHALYIQTPLLLHGPQHADVGDVVEFEIEAQNESAASQFAGKTVRVVYSFNPDESNDADAPVSDTRIERIVKDIVLDGQARGSFSWTVPEEVRDHNVDVALVSGDERVAFAFVAIGDAPPAMHIMAASGPGMEPDQENAEDTPSEDASGVGLMAVLGVVALALVRRK